MKLILVVLFSFYTHSDYRAYELTITETTTGVERKVSSTLDHEQYIGYHPLRPTEYIQTTKHWMCWGNQSGFKPICPNPYEDNVDFQRTPANQ